MTTMKGRVALVTGAGGGIGAASAIALAREGAFVVATDRDDAAASHTADLIAARGGTCSHRRLDVTSESDWVGAVEAVMRDHGRLDVLVANAGIAFGGPLTETSLEDWRRVMAVNLDGVFLGVKHAVPAMRRIEGRGRGGSIVVVSSASGVRASPMASAYSASKAAVLQFAKAAALELAPDAIRVNVVLPAGVETDMWRSQAFFQDMASGAEGEAGAFAALAVGTPLKRFAKPEEVAQAVLYLSGDGSSYVTGAALAVDGGFTAA